VVQVLQSLDASHVLPLVKDQEPSDEKLSMTASQAGVRQNHEQASGFVENLNALHRSVASSICESFLKQKSYYSALYEIKGKVEKMRTQSFWRRVYVFYQDPALIQELRQGLDDALQCFHVRIWAEIVCIL
jgi:hypothetical protein